MSFYENTNCPVCGKPFKDDDDIVTCPECGTPHHRECYEKLGKCVNEEFHKDGFDYYEKHKADSKKQSTENKKDKPGAIYNPKNSEINKNYVDDKNSSNKDSGESTNQNSFTPSATTIYTTYDNDKELIDGKSVSDVALCVGVNAQSFIPKFKQLSRKEKKFKWNWGAFFFGPYYFFFRKMYKAGIAFYTFIVAISSLFNVALANFAPYSYEAFIKANMAMSNANVTQEEVNKIISGATDYLTFSTIAIIMLITLLLVQIVIGLFANTIYKNQIINNINKVEANIESGVKNQNMFMYSMGQVPTDDDLRKLMLVKKGSVSFFAPVIAYFAIQMIVMLVTSFM